MGQQEVYDFLKHHPKKWYSSKEIARDLGASIGSITTTLTKLRKSKEVVFKMSNEKTTMFLYKFKG